MTVGAQWELLGGTAEAAPLSAALRRSTWNGLHDPRLTARSQDLVASFELVQVADLPVAESLHGLRGHDGAFTLQFSGPPGFGRETTTLASPELGTVELFLAPVGLPSGGVQPYEAVIDRTVRIAGINEDGAPLPVQASAARSEQPTSAGAVPAPTPSRVKIPALRRSALARSTSKRRATLELSLTEARDVVGVRAVLMHGGTVVARSFSARRAPRHLRLRLSSAAPLSRSRYQLVVRMTTRDGTVTSVRRSVTLS